MSSEVRYSCQMQGGETEKLGSKLAGNRSIFALADMLTDTQKQELAWGSYALLRNTKMNAVVWSALISSRWIWITYTRDLHLCSCNFCCTKLFCSSNQSNLYISRDFSWQHTCSRNGTLKYFWVHCLAFRHCFLFPCFSLLSFCYSRMTPLKNPCHRLYGIKERSYVLVVAGILEKEAQRHWRCYAIDSRTQLSWTQGALFIYLVVLVSNVPQLCKPFLL